MIVYYRLAGVIATLALGLNVLIMLACISLFKGTLTLPGIAGLILTLGMSVDTNVLVYERMREEMKLGKALRAAIAAGYHRAWTAIIDAHLTTILAAVALFVCGTGPIRGFSVTLIAGLLANLMTAILCTKVIFDTATDQFGLSKLHFMHLFPDTKIDFIGKRRICYTFSIIFILGGILLFTMRGEKNYSVDFLGGTLQQYMFDKPVRIDEVRRVLKELGHANASLQQYGNPREIIVRTQDNISTALTLSVIGINSSPTF